MFDTWGGVLSPASTASSRCAYMERIARDSMRERDGRRVPLILFTKGGGAWLEEMAASGATRSASTGRRSWPTRAGRAATGRAAGQPRSRCLYAPPARSAARCPACWRATAAGQGHVFNLGHGIQPDMNPEHARRWSRPCTSFAAVSRAEAGEECDPPWNLQDRYLREPPRDVNVLIEIPQGGSRSSTSSTRNRARCASTVPQYGDVLPGNYGFIPHTLSGDGDPIDVIVVGAEPGGAGAIVRCGRSARC